MSDDYCKGKVFERSSMVRGWGESRPCSKKPVRDGYCATHHPDAEKKRREAVDARWREEAQRRQLGWDIDAAEREVVRAAVEACEGAAADEFADSDLGRAVTNLKALRAKRGAP